MNVALYCFDGALLLPLSIAVALFWLWRLNAATVGKSLRNGIPHHGMMILIGSQYLLMLGIGGMELWVSITLHMQDGSIAFAWAKVFSSSLLVIGVWLMCRIKCGYSPELIEFSSSLVDPEAVNSEVDGKHKIDDNTSLIPA